MVRSLISIGFAAVIGAGLSSSAHAQDIAGSADHPMISRYEGSTIAGFDTRKFDELVVPLGPVEIDFAKGGVAEPKRSQKVEGRLTRLLYLAPLERSPLEVYRNYELELRKRGFETLFACAAAACGSQPGAIVQFVYSMRADTLTGQNMALVLTMAQEPRYLAAKRKSPQGDTYASILIAKDTNPGVPGTYNRTVTLLEVVEAAPMETGLVTVSAATMDKEITASGHVALYGIYFETNKADVKLESASAIQEIARLLKETPGLRLIVVGHTDNVGSFDANMALSERRATAVIQELTTKHGIAAARLRAVGVGMVAPIAPNDTEEGRAKNRRVELVKQ